MKNILFLTSLFSFLSLSLVAQITVTRSDFPSRGDVFFILEDDDMSGLTAGGTGMQTWNFTSLDVNNLDTILFVEPTLTPPYATPFDTLFPNSNLALSGAIGGVYLNISNDSLMLDGVAADLLGQGFVTPININPDLKLIEFPANYLNSFSSTGVVDTIIDTVIGIADKIRLIRTQTNIVALDAYGTLNLPNGSHQTLRMFTTEIIDNELFLGTTIGGNITWVPQPAIAASLDDTIYRYNWIAKNEGYYVMEAIADQNGNLESGFFKSSTQVLAFPSQVSNASCKGACDGSIQLSAVGGTGSYSYSWSANAGGGSGNSASGLCAGEYYFTVTDNGNSSTYTDTIRVTEPNAIVILVSTIKESPLGNDGEIRLSVSGGTAPYSYAWTGTSQTTRDVNSLSGGSYSVTVTDANSCTADTSITLGTRVGVNEMGAHQGLQIYPNPANERVYVQSSRGISEIKLIDMLGKSLLITNDRLIATDHLENGVYLVEIKDAEGGLHTSRLVVQH